MSTVRTALIDDAGRALLALSPLRRKLLELLRKPGSAATLAEALDMPRQRIGYHLKALEAAGLVTLHAERQRRGFTERLFVATAESFILDPAIMGGPAPGVAVAQDRYAAGHLIAAAAATVRDVTRMRSAAEAAGKRLLTFTIEAELRFARPADIEAFTTRLAAAVAALADELASTKGGRCYRLMAGGHPAAVPAQKAKPIN